MKFGKYLLEKQNPEWASEYIDYARLKALIKEGVAESSSEGAVPGSSPLVASLSVARTSGDSALSRFFRALDAEVSKISAFTERVVGELRQRLSRLQERAKALAARQQAFEQRRANGGGGGGGGGHEDELGRGSSSSGLLGGVSSSSSRGGGGGGGGIFFDASEERSLQDERATLLAEGKRIGDDILALEKYVNLNYMGFHKILKKHDKALPSNPVRSFYVAHLHQQPWVQGNYSDMMVLLSNAFSLLRGDTLAAARGGSAQAFNRSTTKYWIRTEDVSAVKRIIIENMPVFVFDARNYVGDAQLVNSVYFDNDSLELYHGRLDKKPGAIALRVRWYGNGQPRTCFIERKVHRESWKGEKSVKERFTLPEELVVPFLEGDYTVDDYADALRAKGRPESDVAVACDLFSELQRTVDAKQLVPLVRTQYMRSAFQMGHDRRVSFTLDTNLIMLKEDPEGHPTCTAMRRWYRDPSLPVHRTEITRFPHAVLEIKLALPEGEEAPDWVKDLAESDLVTEIHKMSKFIHGTAVLFPDRVQAVPYWIDDESLRDSILASAPIVEGNGTAGAGAGGGVDGLARGKPRARAPQALLANGAHGADGTDGSGSLSEPLLSPPSDADGDAAERSGPVAPRLRLMGGGNRGARGGADGDAGAEGAHDLGDDGLLSALFRAPIATSMSLLRRAGVGHSRGELATTIPQRLEPKTFLASERTFLSWLHMAITLASISAALLAFAGSSSAKRDPLHRVGGNLVVFIALTLLPLAIVIAAYAAVVFHWRSRQIALKRASYIDDRRGPYLLVALVVAALGAIFVAAAVDFVDAWRGDALPSAPRAVSGAFQIAGQMTQH